jgi:hypothetical protein
MNSKQINFYITPDNLPEIDNFFMAKESVIVRGDVTLPNIALYDLTTAYKEKIFQAYLTKKYFLNSIYFKKLDSKDYYYLYEVSSLVVQFSLGGFCPYNNKELHRSRLYYICKYYDDSGKFVSKPKEFIEWADDIIRDFKKQFLKKEPKYSKELFSEQCLKWIEENNAKLTDDGTKLVIN